MLCFIFRGHTDFLMETMESSTPRDARLPPKYKNGAETALSVRGHAKAAFAPLRSRLVIDSLGMADGLCTGCPPGQLG